MKYIVALRMNFKYHLTHDCLQNLESSLSRSFCVKIQTESLERSKVIVGKIELNWEKIIKFYNKPSSRLKRNSVVSVKLQR